MRNLYSFNNIFEHSNARYLSSDQLAHEFVWTPVFESLLTNKHHVILGSRGSGKTALVKMLSHECLAQLPHAKAREIIQSRSFIATYLPLKVEWVSSISDIDQDNSLFIWSINISSCARFIDTIKSCLSSYIDCPINRVISENNIAKKISDCWLNKKLDTLTQVSNELEEIEFKKNIVFNKIKLGVDISKEDNLIGFNFSSDLFKPIEIGVSILKSELNISDESTFCLCIDEAEFLNIEHHRILNTYMRSFSNLIFKLTTMPYRHYTLETLTSASLNIGHDFEYINIDKHGLYNGKGITKQYFEDFAENLFKKRLEVSGIKNINVSLRSLLGDSMLIDNPGEVFTDEMFLKALNEFCDEKTIFRALKLQNENLKKYNDEIGRKLKGTLLLKESYKNFKGNSSPKIYSGYSLIVRCSDGNPRRLLRLFNYLFSKYLGKDGEELVPISEKEQGDRIRIFSYTELENLNIEIKGKEAFELFSTIGLFLKEKLHDDKVSTDVFNSFNYDVDDDSIWEHIQKAVDLGLIYPEFKSSDQDNKMPNRKGTFGLALCLAPHFYLMPRKGKAVSLNKIIQFKRYSTYKRHLLIDADQINLDYGDCDE